MHEFPLFGERKLCKKPQRQAHFQKHHEFPLQIEGFQKGPGGDVITLPARCNNSARSPFRHWKMMLKCLTGGRFMKTLKSARQVIDSGAENVYLYNVFEVVRRGI